MSFVPHLEQKLELIGFWWPQLLQKIW
jgi:hypothetical protein